jgi:hypothetical protein
MGSGSKPDSLVEAGDRGGEDAASCRIYIYSLKPKPYTLNPKPYTLNPKP